MATMARHTLPSPPDAMAARTALVRCPLPQPTSPRALRAMLWLYRLLFVQPVGRRSREERLGALPDRTLRDIGLKRADVRAATWGPVRLCDVLRKYPSAGPLYVCGRPDFPLTLVRLSEAA
jgi:uncharacterized protein YjiS (DUF1127 family)